MSVCLCIVGRHTLNTDSMESVARQLSDIFDINILWEELRTNHFVELGRIVKHEDKPFFSLTNSEPDEPYMMYELASLHEDDKVAPFFYMGIYREMVDIDLYGWPYRATDYERCFWEQMPPMGKETAEWMREFRLRCKEVFGKLGSSKCISFTEDTGQLEDSALNLTWDEYERYVLSGDYLKDVEESWRKYSTVINVSDFISGKNPTRTRCGGFADVFVDDFADLEL